MRWDGLFADLEAQLAQSQWQVTEAEAAEMTRGEWAGISLEDRLRGARGARVAVHLEGGERLDMTLSTVGSNWFGGTDGNGSLVVNSASVMTVEGQLASTQPEHSVGRRNLGVGSLYRSLSRARAGVVVWGRDGRVLGEGTIDRVGADHFDVAVHPRDEQRRHRNIRGVKTVPFNAVRLVRSAHASSV
ncbi:hypothetical protein [Citricoccus sp. GCM10030269]|uniref:hypothetical protein n=1 Tax=Citricoccus sp. GCM10030269 TaxID=3273388 RepID=UPI003605D9A9